MTTATVKRGRPSGESRGTRAIRVVEDCNIALYLADTALNEARTEVRRVRAELAREQADLMGTAA